MDGGIKLFGACKIQGKCVCTRCALAPINQNSVVRITRPDGTVELQPDQPLKASSRTWGHQPYSPTKHEVKRGKR